MIRNIGKFLFLVIFSIGTSFADQSVDDFNARLDTAFKTVMSEMQKNSSTYAKSSEALYQLLDKQLGTIFDFELVVKRITGKYYKDLSAEELAEFLEYFKHSLFENFSSFLLDPNNLKSFKDKTSYKLGNFSPSPSNQARASQTVILKYDGKSYNLNLSLHKASQQWMAENIILDNLNVGLNYRNQFYTLMEKYGDIQSIMKNWKNAEELEKITKNEMGVNGE